MTYLAIDYGTKRVGVAVNRLWLAEPVAVFDRSVALQKIAQLIAMEKPDALVLGIPDGPMVIEGRAFVKELLKHVGSMRVIEADETLSSVETQKKMIQSGMKRSKRQGPIDHFAAAAILQEYMDTHKEEDAIRQFV